VESINRTPKTPVNVAIVGATGAVGKEFLAVLAQRDFPINNLTLLASARTAGQSVEFKNKPYTVQELTENSFQGVDLAFFSAGGSISKKFAPIAAQAGTVVVDNSSAFRMDDSVPLVIPEVNPQAVQGITLRADGETSGQGSIIANPNCSTIIMLLPVTPLHRIAQVKRIVVSTYQAASGAGAAAMQELQDQTRSVLAGQPPELKIFTQQYAFNLFSHDSALQPNGYNQEEMKMVQETHKIWADPSVGISATCVRVPVLRAHAESVTLTFEQPLDADRAREVLANAPGVSVIDDWAGNRFPTPLGASHQDDVYVGRIRPDISQNRPDNTNRGWGLNLFVCGDQLRKGAALNAVQIAELLL